MKKIVYLVLALLLVIPVGVYAEEEMQEENNIVEEVKENVKDNVIYVMTNDSKSAKFRKDDNTLLDIKLLGITVPEKSEEKTLEFLKHTLENADKVVLEYDNLTNSTDAYGKTYAWVFVDDILLQEILVKEGYANISSEVLEYKYMERLEEARNEAKAKEVGIWEVVKEEIYEEEKAEVKPVKKNFFQKILASVGNFFDQILESILKLIDSML